MKQKKAVQVIIPLNRMLKVSCPDLRLIHRLQNGTLAIRLIREYFCNTKRVRRAEEKILAITKVYEFE
jgi:hypothetical protein